MLTTEERQFEFGGLVQSMRTAQKEFIESRGNPRVLENAKYYERQVDRALRRFRNAAVHEKLTGRKVFDA